MIFELQRSRNVETIYAKHRKFCPEGDEDDSDDDDDDDDDVRRQPI
jgi:hypothetical protein